jgi:hypothetical protein
MRESENHADLHAARREQRRRKKQYGMRTAGAGARLLARLAERPVTARAGKKRRASRRKT